MPKNQIKISKAEAKKEIEDQIQKAKDLYKKGEQELSSSSDEEIRARDNFKILYKHWENFTCEMLRKIFVSSSYASEFVKVQSSKVEYVSSSWIPDIEYYLEKQMTPKVDYLGILIQTIDQFTEIKEEKKQSVFTPPPDNNLDLPEKVTLSWLWKHVPAKFWFVLIGLFIAAFILGVTLGQIGWVKEVFGK